MMLFTYPFMKRYDPQTALLEGISNSSLPSFVRSSYASSQSRLNSLHMARTVQSPTDLFAGFGLNLLNIPKLLNQTHLLTMKRKGSFRASFVHNKKNLPRGRSVHSYFIFGSLEYKWFSHRYTMFFTCLTDKPASSESGSKQMPSIRRRLRIYRSLSE